MSGELERHASRNRNQPPRPSLEFSEVLKYEMALTAETMNQELTELQVMGYVEALSDLSVEKLRAGFKRARRTLQFFPKPAEVRSLAHDEIEETRPKQYYLPEPEPIWTPEDRAQWVADIAEACGKKPPAPPMTEAELQKRKEFLRKQAEELKTKASGA